MTPRSMRKYTFLALLMGPLACAAMDAMMVTEGSLTGVDGWDPSRSAADNVKSGGGEAKLYLQPTLVSQNKHWLITPNYDFEYSNVNQVLAVDDSIFLFNQYMSNLMELGGAWRDTAGQRLGLKGYYNAVNGVSSTNENLNTGLYCYDDLGVKASWRLLTDAKSVYTLGVAAYSRRYPNYYSLDPQQRHDKDANIVQLSGDAEIHFKTKTPFMTLISYSLQNEGFTESVVIDASGTTVTSGGAASLRKDIVHNFALTFPFQVGTSKVGLGYTLEARLSNFNYIDPNTFLYITNYEQYYEHGLHFSYAYDFGGPWWFFKSPEFSLDADVFDRLYTSRPAKKSDGTYDALPPLETDNRYEARIGLNSPFTEHWSANTSMDFLGVTSNNLDASTSLVNYKLYTFRLGLQFNY